MGITITSTNVTIDTVSVSFEDIYQAAVTAKQTATINKLNNSYLITQNIYLTNGASIVDTNKFVTVLGQYIQIPSGCTLRLGTKRTDGSTSDGCTLNAPNIYNNYGFGSTTTTNSGNLFLYQCVVNIFGYWSFFQGNNQVEIIDCFIDGFGRISGPNSILKNIIFKRSHGRYGSLSTKGSIASWTNTSVFSVFPYTDPTINNSLFQCSIYHNPDYATNVDIYYGEYSGYQTLMFVENTVGSFVTTLYGSKVDNGYSFYRRANNHSFYHKYRFHPKIQNVDGSTVSDAQVTIKNVNGVTEFTGTSDTNGYVDSWLTYLQNIINVQTNQIMTPHTVTIVKGSVTFVTSLYVNKNMDDFPLFLLPTSIINENTIDYDKIQSIVQTSNNGVVASVCACSSTNSNAVQDKISQVMLALGEDVLETQTMIQGDNGVTVLL